MKDVQGGTSRTCRCARSQDGFTVVQSVNKVPGARSWETADQTEERKWVAYLMRQHPRALTLVERRAVELMFAVQDGIRRSTCHQVSEQLGLDSGDDVHRLVREALDKIGYDRRRRA